MEIKVLFCGSIKLILKLAFLIVSSTDESKALEAKQRAEEAMSNAQGEQDLSTTQAALAESLAQLQMITKMRGKKR